MVGYYLSYKPMFIINTLMVLFDSVFYTIWMKIIVSVWGGVGDGVGVGI